MFTTILIYTLLGINILVSLLLVLLILMQRPKSEGLGTAFGSGVTESIFGAQTSDILTKATLTLGAIFIVATLSLAILYSHRKTSSIYEELFQSAPPIQQQTGAALTTPGSSTPVAPSSAPALPQTGTESPSSSASSPENNSSTSTQQSQPAESTSSTSASPSASSNQTNPTNSTPAQPTQPTNSRSSSRNR